MATYNLLNYPGTDGTSRHPYFRAVLRTMNPDILVVQEMESAGGVTSFRDQVLNAVSAEPYTAAPFFNGPDTDNSLFYRADRVMYLGATHLPNSPRYFSEYRLLPVGTTDTFRIVSIHLKAQQEDSLARLTEATTLRNYLNGLPAGTRFIVAGDYNIYRSTEPAFLRLTQSEADNDGRCFDPLNAVGTWNNNFAFRAIHTQSPRTRAFGDGSTGGLDDRFDILLLSSGMQPHLLPSTYRAYGNDGAHFNDSINDPPNLVVADSVADGLHYASDHLPVFADFRFGTVPLDTGFTSIASGSWSTPSIWSGGTVPGAGDAAVIGAGTTVTLGSAGSCAGLSVRGALQFDGTDGRVLTVGGDVTIHPGGELRPSAPFASGSTTQVLALGGSFRTDGGFTARVSGTSSGLRVLNVTFSGAVPAVIAGAASPVTFNLLRMEMAGTGVTLTPLVPVVFAAAVTNALTLVRGTWVQSVSATTTPSVNITVDSAAVLAISDGGTFTTGSASLIVRGVLDLTGGALTVGAGNNRLEVPAGGTLIVAGGEASVNGRLTLSGGTTLIEGGRIGVDPRGTTPLSSSSTVVEVGAGAALAMSGGTLAIQHPRTATGTGRELRVVSASASFTGGLLEIGEGGSTLAGSDSGFVLESAVPLPHMRVHTGGGAGRTVSPVSALTVAGLTLESGDMLLAGPFLPGSDLSVAGPLRRASGLISAGGRAVRMVESASGAPDTIGAGFTGPAAVEQLIVEAASGAYLEGDLGVGSLLHLTGGMLVTGAHAVVLDSTASLVESPGAAVRGRVRTTRSVQTGVEEDFGGMGLALTAAGAAPGMTTLERVTGEPVTVAFSFSISRVFTFSPAQNSGLSAAVRFAYADADLNGQEEQTLGLWRSDDGGTTWSQTPAVADTAANTLEIAGTDSLGMLTASDAAHPLALTTLPVDLREGWGLVSLPVATPLDSVHQVFPAVQGGTAFTFTSAGYQSRRRLENGAGYWVKHGSDSTVAVTGIGRSADTVDVAAGWNIIGTVSWPVDTASVVVLPPGNRLSAFIGFTGVYAPADTLFPGRAYWVKMGLPGSVLLGVPARKAASR